MLRDQVTRHSDSRILTDRVGVPLIGISGVQDVLGHVLEGVEAVFEKFPIAILQGRRFTEGFHLVGE